MKKPSGTVRPILDGKKIVGYKARITWQEGGKRRDRSEITKTKNEALDKVNGWRQEWEEAGTISRRFVPSPIRDDQPRTFSGLCTYYNEHHAKPAIYRDGKKISGMRDWQTARGHVKHLQELIGDVELERLTWAHLSRCRDELLAGKTAKKTPRSMAYVNRIMSRARKMLKVARQQGWMTLNPFDRGEPLVTMSLEADRDRIVTPAEESALIEACGTTHRRAHMRMALVLAVETGMRLDEILTLQKWERKDEAGNPMSWIDWQAEVIRVAGWYTKSMTVRIIPMTGRLTDELKAWLKIGDPADARVFGSGLDKVWRSIRAETKIEDLRFHDLRHTAATRMIEAGIPERIVGKILGHRQPQTTGRYVNVDERIATEAGEKLDALRKMRQETKQEGETVN